ncbi:MAG: GNAT family N-acetyltransferase [Alteromonadaceae bacterium]|nr:GNAT family N-acetyltransferase [Alteromonadaceae bacterium]
MCSIEFTTKNDLPCKIEIDEDGQEIIVKINGTKKGSISLTMYDWPQDYFYITNLSLDNCRRMGIGRKCLQFHKKVFDAPITAASPYSQDKLSDGSHLTGDGVPFITQMREENLVCRHKDESDEG